MTSAFDFSRLARENTRLKIPRFFLPKNDEGAEKQMLSRRKANLEQHAAAALVHSLCRMTEEQRKAERVRESERARERGRKTERERERERRVRERESVHTHRGGV